MFCLGTYLVSAQCSWWRQACLHRLWNCGQLYKL